MFCQRLQQLDLTVYNTAALQHIYIEVVVL